MPRKGSKADGCCKIKAANLYSHINVVRGME